MRDMTKKQFDAACQRYGFERCGFMGYFSIGGGTEVSIYNAGKTRREQLAYLIREKNKPVQKARRKRASGSLIHRQQSYMEKYNDYY